MKLGGKAHSEPTAKQNADAQGSEITAKAQQQADTLLKEAQKEIQRERQQTLDGVQGEIADLALAAAAHLMEQKVDDQMPPGGAAETAAPASSRPDRSPVRLSDPVKCRRA